MRRAESFTEIRIRMHYSEYKPAYTPFARISTLCEPKNRDSLRAQRPVQSVLSSERARARFSRSPLHNKSLRVSPPLFCPSLSPRFLPVSFPPVYLRPLSFLSLPPSLPVAGISR